MTKKERVGYLLCTVASFISGFIIFAYIGTHGPWALGGVSESKRAEDDLLGAANARECGADEARRRHEEDAYGPITENTLHI